MPGLESIPAWGIAWIVAVMPVSGFAHGVIGFGFPLIATPLLGVATLFYGERIRRRTHRRSIRAGCENSSGRWWFC